MIEGLPGDQTVSVVIVSFESRAFVGDAIASAERAVAELGAEPEIIVVDNASSDGTADLVATDHPDVRLVRNNRNVGFGSANNQAFEIARGRWWVLLNPDARLAPGALGLLVDTLQADDTLAAAGPSISGGGTGGAESAGELPGLRSLAAHFLFLNRLLSDRRRGPWRGWQLRAGATLPVQPVGWLSGAVVVFRPAPLRQVGGFDESIFLYGEDLELCHRLSEAGWGLALVSDARARHVIGGSQGTGSTRWLDGLTAYLERRGRSRAAIAVCLWVVAVGLAIRWLLAQPARGDPRHRARLRAGARRAASLGMRRVLGRE
jgi:GT2 family glycosyltransferase